MTEHSVQWTAPAPLWADLFGAGLPNGLGQAALEDIAAARDPFQRPAILRFTSDTFMEDFLTLLDNRPDQLSQLHAIRETWRGPAGDGPVAPVTPRFERAYALRKALADRAAKNGYPGGLKALLKPPTPQTDVFGLVSPALKLYQPAHMRHYLVTACLVCQAPGLPDRMLNSAAQERVGFVVRRLVPAGNVTDGNPYPADEYAFVKANGKTGWTKVASGVTDGLGGPHDLAEGEERQALFPVTFQQADGRRRRLFAGVIPVGRREVYMGAAKLEDLSGVNLKNTQNYLKPGEQLFVTQITEPWKRLIETAFAGKIKLDGPQPGDLPSNDEPPPGDNNNEASKSFLKVTRDQIQTASWLILLDFARLLKQYLPNVWAQINGASPVAPLTNDENQVVAALQAAQINGTNAANLAANSIYPASSVKGSLYQALSAILADASTAENLEKALYPFDRTQVSTVDIWPGFLFPLADPLFAGPYPEALLEPSNLVQRSSTVDNLLDKIKAALPEAEQNSQPTPPLPLAAQPVMEPNTAGWFVIRCVMERPECDPRLSPALVSEASEPFQMAGFFDPDAPARPIRINLPVDTTPAGLRKFDKNTAFVLSDVLCGQVDRAKGMSLGDLVRSVLPWPLHKDLSLSDVGPCGPQGNTWGMICSLSIPIITICALILLIIIVSLLDLIFHWLPYFIMCFPLPNFRAKETS